MVKSVLGMLSISLLLGTASVHAQQVSIGVRGGMTVPNLTGGNGPDATPLSTGYSSRSGLGFGAFAEIKFSKLFSLQPMVEYSQQGGKKNGLQAFTIPDKMKQSPTYQANAGQMPDYLYANYNSKSKINYLMVPVLGKFGWDLGTNSHFRIYADAGPYVGFLLNAHQVVSGGNSNVYMDNAGKIPVPANKVFPNAPEGTPLNIPFDQTQDIKNQLHSLNWGLEGNVGLAYRFKRSSVFVEGGGNYGLMNIQKGTANGKNHIGAATVMVGYAYDL